MKKENPNLVKGCSTYNGNVYAYRKSVENNPNARDTRHLVNDRDALLAFCRGYIKKSLDLFLRQQ